MDAVNRLGKGSAPDYYLEFGDKYLKKFKYELRPDLAPRQQKWLDDTLKNLHDEIEKVLKETPEIESNQGKFKKTAYNSHVKAYEDAEIWKETEMISQIRILFTPDFSDSIFDPIGSGLG